MNQATPTPVPPRVPLERVLLVDDDPSLLDGLARRLRKEYRIETAPDPKTALELLERSEPFAVVVSDLRMDGGMDGIEFLSLVRQRAPDTTRILLTGFPELETALEAVNQSNIFRFLTKPCPAEQLAIALADGVRQYRLIQSRTELLQMQLQHAQKLAILGQCAAGAAHDLKNALAIIQMAAGAVLSNRYDQQALVRQLTAIQKAATQASCLARDMVDFSRRRTGIDMKPVFLNRLVADQKQMLQCLLTSQSTLEIVSPDDLPPVRGNEDLLAQALANLIGNARDAMPNGGHVTIRLEVEEATSLAAQERGGTGGTGFVRLSVIDTGCGIDEALQARIFDPFFTTKDLRGGTGLGLWNVAETVRNHQGWIEVDSAVGRGTTFRIFLPRAQNES